MKNSSTHLSGRLTADLFSSYVGLMRKAALWMITPALVLATLGGFMPEDRSSQAMIPLPDASETADPAKEVTNSIGMKFIPIKPGTFMMGQDGPLLGEYKIHIKPPEIYLADWDEMPVHRVTITQPFYMATTEVTLGQYRQFDPDFKKNDPKSQPADDDAASGITWDKAVAFCEWLSKKEGKPYRLPTEAEWEYACRAGTTTIFSTGDRLPDRYLDWYGDLSWRKLCYPDVKLMPDFYSWKEMPVSLRVARKPANPWGLYDMHGNLGEWCSDWYGPYENGAQTDPLGRSDGDFRVFRGGSHSKLARLERSANRSAWVPETVSDDIGFRVVLGDLPKGTLLPAPAPPLNMQNVSQKPAEINIQPADVPFFDGPKKFVKIPPDSFGPMFSTHNHVPAITECPNGDLLAVWYSCISEAGTELCDLASRLKYGESEWEPASAFWDGADVNDHAPYLWWDGDKTIFHLSMGHTENIIRASGDNGATWSKARTIIPVGGLSNIPIRTREGVLLYAREDGSISISRDGGWSWEGTDSNRGVSHIRPGGKGYRIPGIHAPVVQLKDGRLMAVSRLDDPADQVRFNQKTPMSYSGDFGQSWSYEESEFPVISSTQRQVMIRLHEGPILLCSYTDQWKNWKERKGLTFNSVNGGFTGYGLFAAVSNDDGKTWPYRRLITPGGKERGWNTTDNVPFTISDTMAEPTGYLSVTQTRDGRIQLITSKNHYVFNLAWLKQLPPAP